MAVTVTETAAKQIQKQLHKRGKGLGLKLAVKKSGCSGYAYCLDFADHVSEGEQVFEQLGVNIIVATADLSVIDGIELDYRKEGLSEAFQFNNPNVKATCGCGESFAV
ncbi:HesB/IscA family protein [Methylocucumis oryzae]|uniref:Heme biosynthesis protein HemY n=1 Tax=Methylocucumis oryzae TaxID=1632867 RepID=A0A0F3IKN7_9GAMM|nr:iron-sulfur cluster assembly accessory protein [Methylocucumis oryzae]KJV06119.1 heme biosynthesis protein HemY [Methylocucumis oryzae]